MKYKLNIKQDVDTDEPGVYILNLPHGWRFTHDTSPLHVYAYDTMRDLKTDVKFSVVPCTCTECLSK